MLFTCFSCLTPYLYPHSLFLTLYPLFLCPRVLSYRYCLPRLTLLFCLPRVPSDTTSPSRLPLSFITRLPPLPSRHNDVDAAFAYDGPSSDLSPSHSLGVNQEGTSLGMEEKVYRLYCLRAILCCLPFGPFLNFSCRTLIRS